MKKKVSAVLACAIFAMGSVATSAWAGCLNATGKIANNAQPGSTTLGVAALDLGGQKLKCAVFGVPQIPTPEGPNFRHTIVCDDKVGANDPQSQLTFNTYFAAPQAVTGFCPAGNPYGPVSFSFAERSVPDPNTARGIFVGVTDTPGTSEIRITGNYNCSGGISMKVDGQICY